MKKSLVSLVFLVALSVCASRQAVSDPREATPSDERRKGHRRSGIGRRIHGDRRTILPPAAPGAFDSDRRTLLKQRRIWKRRTLSDRRSG
jgi:hypothetical protein